jgi:hypothetical protein
MIWITEDDKTCLKNRIQKIQITKKKIKRIMKEKEIKMIENSKLSCVCPPNSFWKPFKRCWLGIKYLCTTDKEKKEKIIKEIAKSLEEDRIIR